MNERKSHEFFGDVPLGLRKLGIAASMGVEVAPSGQPQFSSPAHGRGEFGGISCLFPVCPWRFQVDFYFRPFLTGYKGFKAVASTILQPC